MEINVDGLDEAMNELAEQINNQIPELSFEFFIAKVAHEANRAYCAALGDYSQLPWSEAPEWQKQSCLNGVLFHRENPEATPAASHENWLTEKEREGWKYGPLKDAEKKEHPCFCPFDELPIEQRAKDHIFRAVVRAFFVE